MTGVPVGRCWWDSGRLLHHTRSRCHSREEPAPYPDTGETFEQHIERLSVWSSARNQDSLNRFISQSDAAFQPPVWRFSLVLLLHQASDRATRPISRLPHVVRHQLEPHLLKVPAQTPAAYSSVPIVAFERPEHLLHAHTTTRYQFVPSLLPML